MTTTEGCSGGRNSGNSRRWKVENIAKAFVKAKRQFRPALKEKANPAFKGSRYADLGACIEAVDDAFLANGIVMYQETLPDDCGVTVETVLLHESGESIRSGRLHVPASKQDPQGYGSALTYARRYSLMAACGIAPEDDDGNAASRPPPVREIAPPPAPTQQPMPEEVVAEWLDDMKRTASVADLKTVFGSAWKAAGSVGDTAAKAQFKAAYDRHLATLEIAA